MRKLPKRNWFNLKTSGAENFIGCIFQVEMYFKHIYEIRSKNVEGKNHCFLCQQKVPMKSNNKYQWEEPSAKSTDSEKIISKKWNEKYLKKLKRNVYLISDEKAGIWWAMDDSWKLISIIACCFQASALITYKLCTHTLW